MTTMFDSIAEAHRAIRPQVRVTPMERSTALSELTGCEIYLKCEHVQHTGSFKFRGASNKLRRMGQQAKRGVITSSTGNHGQAVALAGRNAGVRVGVYAPSNAAPSKLDAIRALGAELVLVEGGALAAETAARHAAEELGLPYISPYNDLDVIAGQGTVGMEMLEQCPDLDMVCVSVGGGGLVSGIASAYQERSPATRIAGCWPTHAPSMYASLLAGSIVEVTEHPTLSDGTAGGVEPGSFTFHLCRQLIDDCLLLTEEEIRQAMRLLAHTERWMVEGAAGVALAGMLKVAPLWQGRKIGVVLCGRNVALPDFLAAVQ
ncbi:threonine/serine dehydratase [Pseudoduganella namucuonensis]|uniref:Threonine dehydratase n=1 Tax=Pseudoduganella namucuonensis TaxID=1035707 RepID=A0A1I7KSV1_9BURK|nr:threonine/serine dehydratase [Pseudoduganella namucuonensis]SFV00507.1 threonine dehydratase [Pseudoduganella namucuonensis]